MDSLAQDTLLGDRYRLDRRIAIGGMGEVWRAEDTVLSRTVAVKVLKSELTQERTFLERFRTEARTTASLQANGIANVFDYGEVATGHDIPVAYLVMEYVDGEPLSAQLARDGRLPPVRVLEIVRQAVQINSVVTYASTAVLATNSTVRNIMADLTQEVTSQVTGLSGSLTSLADVGITLTTQPATSGSTPTPQVDNILTVNDGTLSSALATNFQGVANLFGFNLTSDNSNLSLFSATKALKANSFTLNIDPGTSTFTADIGGGNPLINLTPTALPGGLGYLLTGPAGSALDGLNLIYASTSSATINVTATQGIADQMYDTTNTATATNTGTLAVALSTIQQNNTTLNDDITRVNTMVTQYKTSLLQQFSALEQVVSNVNNLLGALSANDQARYTSALTA